MIKKRYDIRYCKNEHCQKRFYVAMSSTQKYCCMACAHGWRKLNKKRRAMVIKLRYMGWSFSKIGKEIGVSRQRAHQIINEEKGSKL